MSTKRTAKGFVSEDGHAFTYEEHALLHNAKEQFISSIGVKLDKSTGFHEKEITEFLGFVISNSSMFIKELRGVQELKKVCVSLGLPTENVKPNSNNYRLDP